MSPKNALTAALLLFVAACVVVLVVKALRARPEAPGGQAAGEIALPADGVVVYYLHGKQRCPTCQAMEANTREAVQTGFGDELESGAVVLREIDYESSGNEHYVQDFGVPAPAPAVVVERRRAGRQTNWKNLERAFELMMTSDKKTFMDYIEQETRAMMTRATP